MSFAAPPGTTFWVRIGGFVVILAMALAFAPSLRDAAAATAGARAATVKMSPRRWRASG